MWPLLKLLSQTLLVRATLTCWTILQLRLLRRFRTSEVRASHVSFSSSGFTLLFSSVAARARNFMVRYKDIEFGKLIGRGSQGEVFLANWKGSIVAIKKVDTRLVPADVIDEFLTEADLICRLRHPCLCLYVMCSSMLLFSCVPWSFLYAFFFLSFSWIGLWECVLNTRICAS